MADIERSKTDLLTLLADNIIGAISPQDIRDFLVSVLGGFGSLLAIANVTNQAVSATPAKVTGWSSNGLAVGTTPAHGTDDITILTDGIYDVVLDACFTGTNGKTYLIAIYKNGADAGLPRIERKIGTGGDVGSSGIGGDISLVAADTVEAYVWSSDGGTAFVPREARLKVKRIG